MELIKKYLTSQTFKLAGLIGMLLLVGSAMTFPAIVNKQKNVSLQSSKAAEVNLCDVRFTISVSTPTPTPTARITPTVNPPTLTPIITITPTLTPTPTLNCQDLDIGLIVDRSSTMTAVETDGRKKLDWAKEAMTIFVQELKKNTRSSSVRVSVDSFGRRGNEADLVLGELLYPSPNENDYNSILHTSLSNNFDEVVLPAINSVQYILPGTCIQCGINIANKQLTSTVNRKVAILLSDGMANKIWTGYSPSTTTSIQAAVDQANEGRSKGIEYRVIGYGKREPDPVTGKPYIDEVTLKKIACGDLNNTECINENYVYKPDAVDWSSAFLSILNSICQ